MLLLAQLVPGFSISADPTVLLVAFIYTLTQFVSWPLVYRISARVQPLLFPLIAIVLSGGLVYLISEVLIKVGLHSLRIDNVQTGIVLTLGLSASYTLFAGAFSLRDTDAYTWFVIERLRRTFPVINTEETPGTLFIEIDGLSAPLLQRALDDGWMPHLEAWQADGSYTLNEWETDLSSQTSASQAGILLGNNHNIPAFRWYDKPLQRLMVSSSMNAAKQLEDDLSSGDGLLRNGASRWNVFSGDAPDSLLTFSTVGVRNSGATRPYLTMWASPYMIMRTAALLIGDIFRERWQAWRQRREHVQPRVKRTFKYAMVRAATTTLMLELSQFMLLADMYRGVSSVYCTIFAYDEVAHHSGIDRTDAFKVLTRIDHMIGVLRRESAHAARPYHIIVLSDHGQSMGATFRQRNGKTLGNLVEELVSSEASIQVHDSAIEDRAAIRLSLEQALQSQLSPRSKRLVQSTLRHMQSIDEEAAEHEGTGKASADDVMVLASGNLGLISFPKFSRRLTFEEITEHSPRLISGLLANPDIGFVMVKSATEGALVLGRQGIRYLSNDEVTETDPLEHYPERAADHLRRTDSFDNAPDILVMSTVDPATNEVYAFEELVGSHGGLGGYQTRPFVYHPQRLWWPEEGIVGAESLHDLLLSWLDDSEAELGVLTSASRPFDAEWHAAAPAEHPSPVGAPSAN
ncbi:MAG: alkaline phosphatase family protein [Thermomicrobiales bacterium]|nr:alkaline phosphatase family protein [Thermomicrobiales bacterium]